jgi:outer membrane lipoprotein-sorting protein
MNRDYQDINRVDSVSDFVDILNAEKKPQISDDYEDDIEMMQLFETVRAVKRLKGNKINIDDKTGVSNDKPEVKRQFPYKRISAIAAVFIMVFISAKMIMTPQNNLTAQKAAMESPESAPARALELSQNRAADMETKQEMSKIMESSEEQPIPKNEKQASSSEMKKNKVQNSENVVLEDNSKPQEIAPQEASIAGIMEAPQTKMFSGNNIIYAMDRAYEGIVAYSGNIEIRYEDNAGSVSSLEKIEVKYKKPGSYKTVIEKNNSLVTKISDGEKLYVINSDEVTVKYLGSDEEVWKYLLGESIEKFKKAASFKQVGDDIIKGKEAFVYEFSFSDDKTLNRIWIDKTLNLPVKQELNMPDGTKIISQLMNLDVNSNLDESIFKYEIKEGQKVNYE